jgi:hypothetical protein
MKIYESEIEYNIECLPEYVDVRGNAMCSGDDDYDRQVEDSIIEDFNNGNEWAWCTVRVTASIPGLDYVEGDDYLGCCSYKNERDFVENSCYYEDMKEAAKDQLLIHLENLAQAVLSFVEREQE